MDIRDIFGVNLASKETHAPNYKTKKKALDDLRKFINHKSNLAVGDEVERNAYGLDRYNGPVREENDVAIVTHIYSELQTGDEIYDAVITMTCGSNTFVSWKVDSRFYKKVGDRKNVIDWRKKKETK